MFNIILFITAAFILSISWISSNVDAFPTPSPPSKVNNGEVKRLKQINDILQTLGLPNKVEEENNNGKYEKFRQSIDPQIVKRILLSPNRENGEESDDEEKEMVFVWKMDKLIKQCHTNDVVKSFQMQFLFNLKLFNEESVLAKASIYFYKKEQTPTEHIAVKEVPNVGTQEYFINSGIFDKKGGWVQLDITRHVDYWTGDYGNSELRTLKLECGDDCKELNVEHCDSKKLPFLYIALKSKTK